MSLYLNGKVDPIAAQGKRQLSFIPKHFHIVNLNLTNYYVDANTIRNWIWRNQDGRFALETRYVYIDNRIASEFVAAFEDSSEAIMFSFIAPTLQDRDSEIFI